MHNDNVVYLLLDSVVAASGSVGMMEEVFDSLSGKKHSRDPDGFSDYLESIGGGLTQGYPALSVHIDTPLSIARKKETGDFEIIKNGAIGSVFNIQLHYSTNKSTAVTA
jgi:hypothetical protein